MNVIIYIYIHTTPSPYIPIPAPIITPTTLYPTFAHPSPSHHPHIPPTHLLHPDTSTYHNPYHHLYLVHTSYITTHRSPTFHSPHSLLSKTRTPTFHTHTPYFPHPLLSTPPHPKLRGSKDKHIIDSLLESMRMVDKKHIKASQLSGGQRRKLSILQAIVYGTEVSRMSYSLVLIY